MKDKMSGVCSMRKMRNAYRILICKLERMRRVILKCILKKFIERVALA
jgi:hypothetical protein